MASSCTRSRKRSAPRVKKVHPARPRAEFPLSFSAADFISSVDVQADADLVLPKVNSYVQSTLARAPRRLRAFVLVAVQRAA
jgi:hypothetical protein